MNIPFSWMQTCALIFLDMWCPGWDSMASPLKKD